MKKEDLVIGNKYYCVIAVNGKRCIRKGYLKKFVGDNRVVIKNKSKTKEYNVSINNVYGKNFYDEAQVKNVEKNGKPEDVELLKIILKKIKSLNKKNDEGQKELHIANGKYLIRKRKGKKVISPIFDNVSDLDVWVNKALSEKRKKDKDKKIGKRKD